MVVVQSKTQASSSPLSIAPQSDTQTSKNGLSFSELLRGVSSQKDEKTTKNATLVLALSDDKTDLKRVGSDSQKLEKTEKQESLLSLLKGKEESLEKTLVKEKSELAFNPQITEKISPTELKTLIADAKKYLKDKITSNEAFNKSDIESLPKTLKGLAQVAEKLGIDVSKITLEELRSSTKLATKTETTQTATTLKEEASKLKESEIPVNDTPKENSKNTKTSENKLTDGVVLTKNKDNRDNRDNVKTVQSAQTQIPQEKETVVKETPLFKAQTKSEISTQEMVNAKSTAIELRKPKEKAEDTLKLLLRTDKSSKSESGMTADFSVATARVIVSQTEPSTTKGLESLLHGSKDEGTAQAKFDGLNVLKSDSFDVKINEAKQMVKYLSQDVKTAIEDYKSPFTRVKVQLNPQKLGEVDLTVVQRGKNLHISLSSNNTAINTLALNANDLRAQLTNNGIQNASLNFSNNSQSQDGSAGQQQQSNHHQNAQANEEYNYFEKEEANEEILSSLEIVVPNYA